MKMLCLDWDGVVHSYSSGWKGADVIPDPPVPGAVAFVLSVVEDGQFEVAIYSSRSHQPGGIVAMKEALTRWIVEENLRTKATAQFIVESVIKWPQEKPAAFLTLDDRAIQFKGVWPTRDEMLNFRPWRVGDG